MPKNVAQRGVIVPKIATISGRYYSYRSCFGGTHTTAAMTANVLTACRFYASAAFTADRISLNVSVAGAGGTTLRLGLYTADPTTGLPAALLVDSGAIACDSTGAKTATISQAIVAGQGYWLALSTDGTPTVFCTTPTVQNFGAIDATDGIFRDTITRAFTHAALPASWGTPSGYSTVNPFITLRAV